MTEESKKYVKVDGVIALNPRHRPRHEGEASGADIAATSSYDDRSVDRQRRRSLPVVSSMEDHARLNDDLGIDVPLSESADATVEMMRHSEFCDLVGTDPQTIVDEVGSVLSKYGAPMGLANKLMMLSEFDALEFIIDDSGGGMNSATDGTDRFARTMPMTFLEEVRQCLGGMIEMLAHVPLGRIAVEFLNREDRAILAREGRSPAHFIRDANDMLDEVFAGVPTGGTPPAERMQQSLIGGAGKSIARYFFGIGIPNGGGTVQNDIIDILVHRRDPAGNPITFISPTREDDPVEWMKDAEELVPFCSISYDFNDERMKVRRDQGAALPYTRGFHFIRILTAAINPDDLDAMHDSVPFTKDTLDNLLGIKHPERSYRYYFDCFVQAQHSRTVEGPSDQLRRNVRWNYIHFLHAPVASDIPQVQQFRQQLRNESTILGKNDTKSNELPIKFNASSYIAMAVAVISNTISIASFHPFSRGLLASIIAFVVIVVVVTAFVCRYHRKDNAMTATAGPVAVAGSTNSDRSSATTPTVFVTAIFANAPNGKYDGEERRHGADMEDGNGEDVEEDDEEDDDEEGGRMYGYRIKISDVHVNSVVVYHVDDDVVTCERTDDERNDGLRMGCELLAINDVAVSSILVGGWRGSRRGMGGIAGVVNAIRECVERDGKASILASYGDRPRGSLYLLARYPSSSSTFVAKNDTNVVEGLALEEVDGTVRVVDATTTAAIGVLSSCGIFAGLKVSGGDRICGVNGMSISSIDDIRYSLASDSMELSSTTVRRRSSLVPVLTYNPYRKIRSALMTVTICNSLVRNTSRRKVRPIARIDDEYDIGEKLGEGAFAVVKKATDRATGRLCAMKIVNRSSLNKNVELALRDEICILRRLNHDNVMTLYDSIVTIEKYFLVTELLEGGELFDRIVDKCSYTESEARDVCGVLFGALDYISSRGIVHRDLKPENLLLSSRISDTSVKIADFGLAKLAPGEDSLTTMCGTPGYIAPEILRREKYGTKSDMWSMGVIVFILLGGYPPFYSRNMKKLLMLTMAGKFEFDPEYWGDVSQSCKDMISSLLKLNPTRRVSAVEVLNHPWMEEDRERLRRINLNKSQSEMKKVIARTRFRKAINCVVFVNDVAAVSCQNAIFSGRNKRKRTKAIEDGLAHLPVSISITKD